MKKKLHTRYVALFALAMCAAASSKAKEYTFNGADGDLATPANWGADALGSSDIGTIEQGGTYTLSGNLTLSQLKIATTSQCTFDFVGSDDRISLSGANHPIDVYTLKNNANVILKGGVWDFGGKEFRGQYVGGIFWLRNGAKIENAGNFYNCYYAAPDYTDMRLLESSSLSCASFYLANNNTIAARIDVASGSKIVATTGFVSDKNSDGGLIADNVINVMGDGSEISATTFTIGNASSRNKLNITDSGKVSATGKFVFGNRSNGKISSTNTISMSCGTLAVGGDFFTQSSSCDNVFSAEDSTVTIGTLTNLGTRSVFDFQNCTVRIGEFRPFLRNGGRFSIRGLNSEFEVSSNMADVFKSDLAAANNDNHLVIDDRANVALVGNYSWMATSSNSSVSVRNGAKLTVEGKFQIGYNHSDGVPNCKDNTIEILSGGVLEVRGDELRTYGTRNRVVVDNGTLCAKTVRIGHSSDDTPKSPNCSLVIKGAAPKVCLSSGLTFHNEAVLRFEIPASGYSEGISAIEVPSFVPHVSTTLEVDYSALRDAGGGTVTLVSFDNEPTDGLRKWLAAQEAAMNLPAGTRLRLVQDDSGYKIKFKVRKYSGVAIFVR